MQLQAYLTMQTQELQKLNRQYKAEEITYLQYTISVELIVDKMIYAIEDYHGDHAIL